MTRRKRLVRPSRVPTPEEIERAESAALRFKEVADRLTERLVKERARKLPLTVGPCPTTRRVARSSGASD